MSLPSSSADRLSRSSAWKGQIDMTWNYRILDHGTHLDLHEVFYDDTGRPEGWAAEPLDVASETREELLQALEMALADARNRPVLRIAGNRLVEEDRKSAG